MRILVVEDYEPLRRSLVQALREEGYSVDEASEGLVGWALAKGGAYDVILLDIMLPGLDGLEILKRLRAGECRSQVLMLTARDAVEDRVAGLDGGADDYLAKPFALAELLARVRVLVRRGYLEADPRLRIGHLVIHTAAHEVEVAGEVVVFTAKEYALLEYLAMRRGEVVSRTEIWEHIYDGLSDATSNVVDVYVGYLRKKIEREGLAKLLITRRGAGYMLRCPPE